MDQPDPESTRGQHSPDNLSNDEDDFGDYDIAITHNRNEELKGKPMVEEFFRNVRLHESFADRRTRIWLAELPFHMRENAIPLFVDEDDSERGPEDYQLHPSYTSLELDKSAKQPDGELFCLTNDEKKLEVPSLVIGIGRLFVNTSDGGAGRTSKWTGYEVFVDQRLALWMVFDRRSIAPQAVEWYPIPCRLSFLQDSGNERRVPSYAREGPPFDIACFLNSLRDLVDAEFKTASEEVQKTKQSGRMRISLVERGKVDELLDLAVAPQEVESTSIAQNHLPSTPGTADSHGSGEISETLRDLIWDAVTDDGKNGQKIIDLLDQYKDDFNMIRKVITERIVKEAARNEHCGEKIMSILLDRLKKEVCKNISMEVVKYAAGNRMDGAQIVRKLLDVCGDVVCEKSSVEVICTAAENEKCGTLILDSLLKANEERIKNVIMVVGRLAAEGIDWPRRVLPNLDKKLKELSLTIGFRLISGRQSVRPAPEVQERLEFVVELLRDSDQSQDPVGEFHHPANDFYLYTST